MGQRIKLLEVAYRQEEDLGEDVRDVQRCPEGPSYSWGSANGKHIWLISDSSVIICGREIHLCLKRRLVIDDRMAFDMDPRVLSGSTGMEYRLYVEGVQCAICHDESDNELRGFDVELSENTTEEECSVKISYEMSFQRGFTHSEDVADVRWKKGGELEVITK